jgi:hypothetical protein
MTTQPGANLYTQGFGSRPENVEVPVISTVAPAPSDVNYPIGKRWINRLTNIEYTLTSQSTQGGVLSSVWTAGGGASGATQFTGNTGIAMPSGGNLNVIGTDTMNVVGSGSTLTLSPTTAGFPITPFVVGPPGLAGYQTIQSAINAAEAAASVDPIYIQPGTYTENLVVTGNIMLVGTPGFGIPMIVSLVGTHSVGAASNIFSIRGINLSSSGDIISTTAAGAGTILLNECFTNCVGYTFNVPNWTGALVTFFCLNPGSGDDGFVNNAGGANAIVYFSEVGMGSTFTAAISGGLNSFNAGIQCPITVSGTGNLQAASDTLFQGTITMAGASQLDLNECNVSTSTTSAIIFNSSSGGFIGNTTINSSGSPVLAGTGTGTLVLSNIFCPFNFTYANTLTIAWSGSNMAAGNIALGDIQVVGGTTMTNVNDTTISSGTGSIAMSSTNPATNAVWIKINVGTTPYWIPAWTTNSP